MGAAVRDGFETMTSRDRLSPWTCARRVHVCEAGTGGGGGRVRRTAATTTMWTVELRIITSGRAGAWPTRRGSTARIGRHSAHSSLCTLVTPREARPPRRGSVGSVGCGGCVLHCAQPQHPTDCSCTARAYLCPGDPGVGNCLSIQYPCIYLIVTTGSLTK